MPRSHLVLAVAVCCLAGATAQLPCVDDLLAADTSPLAERCAAMITFDLCIAENRATSSAGVISQLEAMLQSKQQVTQGCPNEDRPPTIRTGADGITFAVHRRNEDINFARHTRSTVSVFDLQRSVDAVSSTLEGLNSPSTISEAVQSGVVSGVSSAVSLMDAELQRRNSVIAATASTIESRAAVTLDATTSAAAATSDIVANLSHRLRDIETRCIQDVTYELAPITRTTDRSCAPVTQCSNYTSYYDSVSPTPLRNRVCSARTPCAAGTFQHGPLTNTVNNNCRNATVCTSDEITLAPATPTSDTVCVRSMRSCKAYVDAAPAGSLADGMYAITQNNNRQARLFCDMRGGGWTLVGRQQMRIGVGNWGPYQKRSNMFHRGCNCGTNYGSWSTCFRDCSFSYGNSGGQASSSHAVVEGDNAIHNQLLTETHKNRAFFTDFVTGSDHRLTFHKNGGAARQSQFWGGNCNANQTVTRAGTISRALNVKNYNGRAAVYYIQNCGTWPRSIWINHDVVWNGENDELCETTCWNGGNGNGDPNRHVNRVTFDEVRMWSK